jgi:hypothetical protein
MAIRVIIFDLTFCQDFRHTKEGARETLEGFFWCFEAYLRGFQNTLDEVPTEL